MNTMIFLEMITSIFSMLKANKLIKRRSADIISTGMNNENFFNILKTGCPDSFRLFRKWLSALKSNHEWSYICDKDFCSTPFDKQIEVLFIFFNEAAASNKQTLRYTIDVMSGEDKILHFVKQFAVLQFSITSRLPDFSNLLITDKTPTNEQA